MATVSVQYVQDYIVDNFTELLLIEHHKAHRGTLQMSRTVSKEDLKDYIQCLAVKRGCPVDDIATTPNRCPRSQGGHCTLAEVPGRSLHPNRGPYTLTEVPRRSLHLNPKVIQCKDLLEVPAPKVTQCTVHKTRSATPICTKGH